MRPHKNHTVVITMLYRLVSWYNPAECCKQLGQSHGHLVSVYVSVVRPVLEYACPVWHTNLPQYLSDNIEVIQKSALKCIFPGLDYAEILRRVNLDTLNVRRDSICQKNILIKLKLAHTY